jgi:hypothetical protein
MFVGLYVLIALQAPPDFERWVRRMGDEEYDVRESAMQSLREAGPAAHPALRDALVSRDPEIAARARWLLWFDEPPTVRVFRLKHADAPETEAHLTSTFGTSPVIRIAADLRTNSIIVWASSEPMGRVATALSQWDKAPAIDRR